MRKFNQAMFKQSVRNLSEVIYLHSENIFLRTESAH